MRRTLKVAIEWRWVILRAVVWIGGTAVSAARGQWVLAGVTFVVVGGVFWIFGAFALLALRRQRHRGA